MGCWWFHLFFLQYWWVIILWKKFVSMDYFGPFVLRTLSLDHWNSIVTSITSWNFTNYWTLFFLVLKKKDIPFLHIYHHTLTLILTHVQLQGRTAVQWVPIILNLGVHSFMYCYYMIATFGYSVWWKKHLTTLQILQFVLDLIFCFYAFTIGWFSNYQDCAGDGFCAFVGITLISSYLLLFIDFFIETYQKSGSTKAENTSREKQKRSWKSQQIPKDRIANTEFDK